MKKNTDIRTLSDKLFSAKRVVLFPHENPDGENSLRSIWISSMRRCSQMIVRHCSYRT